ncbi:MAG: ChbG/HpnK family deacetylase [Ignavibacteria bacterium]|nr:ChbG/HpnK family deacetylase [Ignavibacteria bacterium]
MPNKVLRLLSTIVFSTLAAVAQTSTQGTDEIPLLIRCDDLGMCHAVNMAGKQVMESGIPVSFSVMFACPWYQEAVDLLKQHPTVSIGIHLTLNAEWKNYRWGPVAGRSAVPSLVDSLGYFFPSRVALFANKPRIEEVETELRAQIERALGTGLKIDYVDYHMGTAVSTPEFRYLVEVLATEYGLAISRYFGEVDVEGLYNTPPEAKTDTLAKLVRDFEPGQTRLLVFHIGLATPEMDAMVDLNAFGLREMSKHRDAELRALLSHQFRQAINEKKVRLITYRELIYQIGVKNMRRPPVQGM